MCQQREVITPTWYCHSTLNPTPTPAPVLSHWPRNLSFPCSPHFIGYLARGRMLVSPVLHPLHRHLKVICILQKFDWYTQRWPIQNTVQTVVLQSDLTLSLVLRGSAAASRQLDCAPPPTTISLLADSATLWGYMGGLRSYNNKW